MPEYAVIRDGQIVGYQTHAAPLDASQIKKAGGQLFCQHPDATQTPISESDLPRIIAPYRVLSVIEDGAEVTYLDNFRVDVLPKGSMIGEAIRVGGLPMVRPVREIKPAFDPMREVLVNQGDVVSDTEVVRTYTVAPRKYKVSKDTVIDRLVAAGKLGQLRTFVEASAERWARWHALEVIPNDHALFRSILVNVGADPDVILAPEEGPL